MIKINSNSTRFTHTHTFSSCLVSSSRYGTQWNRRRRLERRHSDENTQWKRICEKNGMSMRRKKGEGSRGCRIESNLDWRACTKCGTMQQGECKARSNRVDQCTRGGMMRGKREKQIRKWRQRIVSAWSCVWRGKIFERGEYLDRRLLNFLISEVWGPLSFCWVYYWYESQLMKQLARVGDGNEE